MIEKIIKVLLEFKKPLTARELSIILNIDKSAVNRVLYQYKDLFLTMNNYQWSIIPQKNHTTISDDIFYYIFTLNFNEFMNYLKSLYSSDVDRFEITSVFYNTNDTFENLIVDLEVYLICSIINATHKSSALVTEQNIKDILSNLKPVLSYSFPSLNLFNYYVSKFDFLNDFIKNLLLSIVHYDDHYETRKSYIVVNKLERTISNYIDSLKNSEDFMKKNVMLQITSLKKFISSYYDYTEGNTNTFIKCEYCGEIVDSLSGDWIDDSFYCEDCYEQKEDDIFIQEASELGLDEDLEIDCETDEYSDEEDIIDEQPLKQIIIEDCTTCLFSKNKTCKKAYLNQICLNYKYFKQF